VAKQYLIGLVGEGIEHSLTPDLHMREASHFGLDYEYRLIDLLDQDLEFEEALARVIATGYDAVNVTFPFKQVAMSLCSNQSAEVQEIGATNLMLGLQNQVRVENTDASGFQFALENGLQDVKKRNVLQVGAGGAGAATAYALLKWGVQQLFIADLDFSKALALVENYKKVFPNQIIRACPLEEGLDFLAAVDGVVQATPIGMYTHPGMPFDICALNESAWVADVIYRPIETEFIQACREGGHQVLTGSLMAIGQAVDSFRLITGLQPDVARMTAHFYELLEDESVLTRARGI